MTEPLPPYDELPLLTGADLPPLGWQHDTPYDPTRFNPVGVDQYKPTGGLWTTPLHNGTWTTWTRFAWQNKVRDHLAPITVIHPDPHARVYRIDNYRDFLYLLGTYLLHEHPDPALEQYRQLKRQILRNPDDDDPIDWRALAADVDALWLTHNGMTETRNRQPGLLMWDVETVFFLNPRLTAGAVVEPRDYEPRRLTPEQIRQDLEKFAAREELALTEAKIAEIVEVVDGMELQE